MNRPQSWKNRRGTRLLLEGLMAAFVLAVSWPALAIANPGDLDPTFGSGGKVTTTFPGQLESLGGAYAVALQPDGKIVAAGWSFSSSPGGHGQFALARYNPDGNLDTTFGSGGRVRTGFGGANARARALALQPDGKIVAAGIPGFSLARYNPDGSLDHDFGVFGTISSNLGNAFALSLQPDGKLIVAGQSNSADFAVARYTPDALVIGGGLDGSFGTGGVATADFRPFDEAFAVAVQPDGKIVAAGRASADLNLGPSVVALARYNPDGSADATFGSGGKVTTAFNNGANDRASALALQPDGKIVVAGLTATSGFSSAFAVARYNPDGSLDGTFGSAGKVITEVGDVLSRESAALAVAVQPDGAIVVAGHAVASGGEFALVRYTPNGTRDVGFGNVGVVTTAFGDPYTITTGNGFYGLALQPDGKIVASGVFSGAFALARYEGGAAAAPWLVAAILPSSRSVQVDTPATAFATVINAGTATATGVGISPQTVIPASFAYRTTDPLTNVVTGTLNTPADIPAGQSQTYVIGLTPTAPFGPTEVAFAFAGSNTVPVATLVGINTLLLSGSAAPVPDIVALAATLNNDGIVNIPGPDGTGIFAVATVNVGASASITATADTGAGGPPVTIALCQTDPGQGVCLQPPGPSVTTQIDAGQTPTFGLFVTGTGTVPFDPATKRIFVRFKDGGAVTRGATSVAVRTQ